MADSYPSDAELWNSIQENDCHAFTLLFKRYWLVLYKTALHYSKDEQASEEIVHDLFVILWNRRQHLQIENFKNYLKTATRYKVLLFLKKRRTTKMEYYDHLPDRPDNVVANKGDENLRQQELDADLAAHLLQLPARCREIFLLSRKEHLSNAEIALQLGISRRSVENQITNALKFLRSNLKTIAILLLAVFCSWPKI